MNRPRLSSRPLAGPSVRALLVGVAIAAMCGCGKKNQKAPEEQGSIFHDAAVSGPSDPIHGTRGRVIIQSTPSGAAAPTGASGASGATGTPAPTAGREYLDCKEPVEVRKADPTTAEGTLFQIFQALLEPDPEKSFEAFYSFINPDFQRKEDAKRYWFGAARKDGSKNFLRLVYGPQDPSFLICRKVPEGPDRIRIFVGKSPPVGSNPPFVLHKVGDKWLLEKFTPQ